MSVNSTELTRPSGIVDATTNATLSFGVAGEREPVKMPVCVDSTEGCEFPPHAPECPYFKLNHILNAEPNASDPEAH